MTTTDAEPGVSCSAGEGSSPRRARAGSAIVHAPDVVRAMLSASTPGTSPVTSTVRAEGSTTPDSIGFASGSETGFPRLKSSTTAAHPPHDEGDARPPPHAGGEAGDVGKRAGIEQKEPAAACLEIRGERVELEREEVVLGPRHDDERRVARHRIVEQGDVLGRIVL